MEEFSLAGKARAIGVSHYCKSHLDDIFEIAIIPPAVNQVRVCVCLCVCVCVYIYICHTRGHIISYKISYTY
jgi:diketogulonate reductase-like aldo/keto reductase